MEKKIEFFSDRIILKEMADGGYQLKIDTGEYSVEAMKEILGMPKGVYKVEITPDVSSD